MATTSFVPAIWAEDTLAALRNTPTMHPGLYAPTPKLTRRQKLARSIRRRTTQRLHDWIHRDCDRY